MGINTSLAEKLSLLYVQSRKELPEMNRQQIFNVYSESLSQFSELMQEECKVHDKKLYTNFFKSNED